MSKRLLVSTAIVAVAVIVFAKPGFSDGQNTELLSFEELKPRHSFEDLFELACDFLSNPWKLWASDRLEDKRMVLKLAFAKRLAYHREQGFSNPIFFALQGVRVVLRGEK